MTTTNKLGWEWQSGDGHVQIEHDGIYWFHIWPLFVETNGPGTTLLIYEPTGIDSIDLGFDGAHECV